MTPSRRRFRDALEADPLSEFVPLPHQLQVLEDTSRIRLLRTGNQLGKTTCGVVDMLCTAIGRHPWNPGAVIESEPVECWAICAAWGQSIHIQRKIWALTPKSLVHPKTTFNEIRGFGWLNPVFMVRHIPSGGWSTIRIKTTGQGPLALSGATIPYAWFDEPPVTDRVFSEVSKRVMHFGSRGRVLLTLTPINAPVDWLRTMAERGDLSDHWYRLEPPMLVPVGSDDPICLDDGTPCDARWIEEVERATLEHEIPVRVHGEWEVRAVGAFFAPVWRPAVHIRTLDRIGRWSIRLGIDHGHRPGKQSAVLVLERKHKTHRQVHVLDEYVDETGVNRPEDDAREILAMLVRNGISWHQLDGACGDRIHMAGTDSEKSNDELMEHIAATLGVPQRHLQPQIDTAKQGEGRNQGSVRAGDRFLYHQMAREGAFSIDPRCKHGIAAIPRYVQVDDEHGTKDWLDGLRYAVHELVFERDFTPGPQVRWG